MRLPVPTSATEAVIDAIAVHRLTKLIQDDDVWPLPELRSAALDRLGDSRSAELLTCPWCLSVHVAALVAVARYVWPRGWPLAARVLAGSAAAGHLAALEQ